MWNLKLQSFQSYFIPAFVTTLTTLVTITVVYTYYIYTAVRSLLDCYWQRLRWTVDFMYVS